MNKAKDQGFLDICFSLVCDLLGGCLNDWLFLHITGVLLDDCDPHSTSSPMTDKKNYKCTSAFGIMPSEGSTTDEGCYSIRKDYEKSLESLHHGLLLFFI